MNRIDKLIEELCPDGVEFKELGEVSRILNGYSFKSDKYVENGIRVIRISDVQKGKISDKDLKYYDIALVDELRNFILKEGDLVMSLTGNVGRVAMLSKQHLPAGLNQRVACVRPKNNRVLVRYLFHYLNQDCFEKEAMNNSTGGGQKNLSTTWLNKFMIPIPPLPIQQEIVNILDTFTALDASLQAELEARRKQYEHYRNQLLNFEGKEVEWKTLGEVGKFIRGKRFVKNDIVTEGVPCIHYGEMYTYYKTWTKKTKSFLEPEKAEKLRLAKPGDVIIVTAGETIEDIGNAVAWLGETNVVIHDACFAYSHSFNPKFVSYFFQTDIFRSQIRKHISSSKISAILESGLSHAKIPVPPLSEQERIVGILDKFDALCSGSEAGMTGSGSGMTGSLPAEIAARRKQYEYYREKLLTFEPLTN